MLCMCDFQKVHPGLQEWWCWWSSSLYYGRTCYYECVIPTTTRRMYVEAEMLRGTGNDFHVHEPRWQQHHSSSITFPVCSPFSDLIPSPFTRQYSPTPTAWRCHVFYKMVNRESLYYIYFSNWRRYVFDHHSTYRRQNAYKASGIFRFIAWSRTLEVWVSQLVNRNIVLGVFYLVFIEVQ